MQRPAKAMLDWTGLSRHYFSVSDSAIGIFRPLTRIESDITSSGYNAERTSASAFKALVGKEQRIAEWCRMVRVMKRPLRVAVSGIGLLVSLLVSFLALSWAKRNIDWFAPVHGAMLTVNGVAISEMRLYRASYAPFALLPDRRMVLVRSSQGQKETYVILGPGPGHLPEGFRGNVRRCESAFNATPLFGFAYDLAPCVAPENNLDDRREAQFGSTFVEFTDDRGKRMRLEW